MNGSACVWNPRFSVTTLGQATVLSHLCCSSSRPSCLPSAQGGGGRRCRGYPSAQCFLPATASQMPCTKGDEPTAQSQCPPVSPGDCRLTEGNTTPRERLGQTPQATSTQLAGGDRSSDGGQTRQYPEAHSSLGL